MLVPFTEMLGLHEVVVDLPELGRYHVVQAGDDLAPA